ncbi:hypothetical protein [Priestia megaterium]|uniref:hypothetical protein n=1 Tax=Priestia megaterium TaxID=1404 RepID=UPI002E23C7AA|nr:hypothetical protein [Priestia megaterium]
MFIDHVKKHRWVIKENGKTVGHLLGKGIIKNERAQEIRWGNNVYMLSSHEAVEEACIFNQKREKVAEFKSDLFHFKEGKHSIRVTEELPVPIFIASYYITNLLCHTYNQAQNDSAPDFYIMILQISFVNSTGSLIDKPSIRRAWLYNKFV